MRHKPFAYKNYVNIWNARATQTESLASSLTGSFLCQERSLCSVVNHRTQWTERTPLATTWEPQWPNFSVLLKTAFPILSTNDRCTRVKVIRVEVSQNVVHARTTGWMTSTRPGKLRDFGLQPRRSNPRSRNLFWALGVKSTWFLNFGGQA